MIVAGIERWDRDNADGHARRDVGDVTRKRRVERRDRDRRQERLAGVRRPKAINESASGGSSVVSSGFGSIRRPSPGDRTRQVGTIGHAPGRRSSDFDPKIQLLADPHDLR